MGDAPAGNITYEGLEAILEGSMVWTHGISPSRASITIIPQIVTVIQSGTLTISYGDTKINFPNCRVIDPSIQYDSGGFVGSFIVEDRRWKWRYPTINGWYNQRTPQGDIDKNRVPQKFVQDLMSLCLDAMGEIGYDVSAAPNSSCPEVVWEEDNAAEELAKLAESVGCIVILGLDNNVRIARRGRGNDLPEDGPSTPQLSQGYGVKAPSRPDKIKFACGPTRFETVFALENVGFDPVTRTILPIDQLSYVPKAGNRIIDLFGNAHIIKYDGWGYQTPGIFYDVQDKAQAPSGTSYLPDATPDEKSARFWALECIWRWYRIVCTADEYDPPPGGFATGSLAQQAIFTVSDSPVDVLSRKQLLPLENARIVPEERQQRQLGTIDFSDPVITQSPRVVGQFIGPQGGRTSFKFFPFEYQAQSDQNTAMDCSFELDTELGIVKLSDYRFLMKLDSSGRSTGQKLPAVLFLQVAHPVRDPKTMVPVRYTFEVDLPGVNVGTKSEVIKVDEVRFVSYPKYQTLTGKNKAACTTTITNQELVDKYALSYLADATFRYLQPETKQVTFAGILSIDLTGVVQQIEWTIGENGCETKASSNTEFKREVPSYAERRRRERLAINAKNESPSAGTQSKKRLNWGMNQL